MRGQVHVVPAAEFDQALAARPVEPMEGDSEWPTREAHAAEAHAHAPQAFIWQYVFSKDHKVIGIQYYVTAMLMALIAGLLAMLIRIQLAWPEKDFSMLQKHRAQGLRAAGS